jgi:hypothetical protein
MYRFFESEHSIVPANPAIAIAGTNLQTQTGPLTDKTNVKIIQDGALYAGMQMLPIPLTTMIPSNVLATTNAQLLGNPELAGPYIQVNYAALAAPRNREAAILRGILNMLLRDEPAYSEWQYAPSGEGNRLDIASEFSADTQTYAGKLVEQGTAICIRLSDTFAATAVRTDTPAAIRAGHVMSDINTLFSMLDINDKTIKSDEVTSVVTQGRIIFQQYTQLHNNNK